MKQFDKAADCHKRALATRTKLGNLEEISASQSNLALDYEGLNQLAKAEENYRHSLKLMEEVSRQVADPSNLGAFQDTHQRDLYARFARLKLRQHQPYQAIELADRARGQALSRQVGFTKASLQNILNAADLTRLTEARARAAGSLKVLESIRDKVDAASAEDKSVRDKGLADAERENRQAEQQFALTISSLYLKYPGLRVLHGADEPMPGKLIAGSLRKNTDTVYIEYSFLDDAVMVFAVAGKKGLKSYVLPITRTDLERRVGHYAVAIQTSAKDERAEAAKLFDLVLGPLAKDGLLAHRFRRLVIVPDGPLLEVPFAALIDHSGARIVESHSLSFNISLASCLRPPKSGSANKGVLIVADPTGAGGATVISPSRGASFAALPGARNEGIAIQKLFSGSTLLVGSHATSKAVYGEIGNYAVLHFATHGYLDPAKAMRSALILAPEEAGKNDAPAMLEAGDIVGMPLRAQIAVLSACNTGEGIQSGGEGLMGLAWAFQAARCPGVVATKWEVDDDSTQRMMVCFYRALLKGSRKDDALREAMLTEMRLEGKPGFERSQYATGRKTGHRSPVFYWAAFQLIGDPSPIHLERARSR